MNNHLNDEKHLLDAASDPRISRRKFFQITAASALVLDLATACSPTMQNTSSTSQQTTNAVTEQASQQVTVLYRKAKPLNDPGGHYPGFKPGTTILKKGTLVNKEKGTLALPCDILFERDVAMKLRDGTVIYTDIYRPVGSTHLPAIVTWSPYGKEGGTQSLSSSANNSNVPLDELSGLQRFEGPDPAYWCNHGYAVVNPDVRGAFMSEGNILHWSSQDARDGYDFIEWVAAQNWASGKVAMAGNSWLSISQWNIASQRPPHLAAIAPWEGADDFYRDNIIRGGIPNSGFDNIIISAFCGKNYLEDTPAMAAKYPLMNSYWEDHRPAVEKITIPAYVVASYTNAAHTHGTFDAYRRISSKEKWLRVHNTQEWHDFYIPAHQDDLRLFFDHYLKGLQNNWKQTPPVRLSVLDPGGADIVDRYENEFPLARQQYKELYLDARSATLSTNVVTQASVVKYVADDNKGQATFTMKFTQDTELTGHMNLRLWVEAHGSNDMDMYVGIQKLDAQGTLLSTQNSGTGQLRISLRQKDEQKSTPSEPFLTFMSKQFLKAGEIVPVDISIWPMGMLWHTGQQLRIIIAGYNVNAGVAGPPAGAPGAAPTSNVVDPAMFLKSPVNKGQHIIHTGGRYNSYLLVPMIPS